jgi:phenylalanyl-tRNA synthetase beta chain
MNIPMSWIREYVDINDGIKPYTEAITMSGTKVEAVETLGAGITGVVEGVVTELLKHENSDKLFVTKVDVGGKVLQIVTGADNLFVGARIPVAVEGAKLANELVIKTTELRGVLSEGMLCSLGELDSPVTHEGIYIFEENQTIADLTLFDEVVEYELTSNRADCYSVIGIAREAAATYNTKLTLPPIKDDSNGVLDLVKVEIENPDLCARYIGRLVTDVTIGESPYWMKARLTKAGMRPINNIVDITNYVMLETGQPLHAFDLDNIKNNKIIVRNARKGEKFTTLDGIERELDTSMLMIADEEKSVAIAGVMGGENSKASDGAKAILFESATFDADNIRITSKKLNLRTDASAKFDKGLDPNLAEFAVNRAMYLVELLGCGTVVSGKADCYPKKRETRKVEYKAENINKLLGLELSAIEIEGYLNRLGIYDGVIPTNRMDIEIEADIAEEVLRMYGYDNIKPSLPKSNPTIGGLTDKQAIYETVKDTLVGFGLNEAFTYAFESPKVYEKMRLDKGNANCIEVRNPLGEDFSVMRTTMLNGMLTSLANNRNKRNADVWLFELAKIYIPKALPLTDYPTEQNNLTIGMFGKDTDFYVLKGMIEGLLDTLNIKDYDIVRSEHQTMHPGKTGKLTIGGQEIGYLGEIHPTVAETYDIPERTYIAELNMDIVIDTALQNRERKYIPIPKFPAISRDISVKVPETTPAGNIFACLRSADDERLVNVEFLNEFVAANLGEGIKSLAFRLTFRLDDRTLTMDEVNIIMENIFEMITKNNWGIDR